MLSTVDPQFTMVHHGTPCFFSLLNSRQYHSVTFNTFNYHFLMPIGLCSSIAAAQPPSPAPPHTGWCALPHPSPSCDYLVHVGAQTSLLCLLQHLAGQTRRQGRNTCSAAFEWPAVRGDRKGRSMLLPGQ